MLHKDKEKASTGAQKAFDSFWEEEELGIRTWLHDEHTIKAMRIISNTAFLNGYVYSVQSLLGDKEEDNGI